MNSEIALMKLLDKSFVLLALLFAGLLIQSCDNNSTGYDFSEAPPPYDQSAAVRDTSYESGLEIYVIQEGDFPPGGVTPNDQIQVRFTARTAKGDIFDTSYYSVYASRGYSAIWANLTPAAKRNQSPLSEGLRKGLLGMKEGEKRIIVIPSEMGLTSKNGFNLSGKTLIYNVELVDVI